MADKMTKNELLAQLESNFAEDEWQSSMEADPQREFTGPDGRYPARLGGIYYGENKNGDLYFSLLFTLTKEAGKFAGQRISKYIGIADTRKRSKKEYLDDLAADLQLLGQATKGLGFGEFIEAVEKLNEIKPTTWIQTKTSTWENESTGEMQSRVYVNVLGPERPAGASAEGDRNYLTMDLGALSALADGQPHDQQAIDEIARRAAPLGIDVNDPAYKTWTEIADLVAAQDTGKSARPTGGGSRPSASSHQRPPVLSSPNISERTTTSSVRTEPEEPTLGELADNGDQQAAAILGNQADELAEFIDWSDWEDLSYVEVEYRIMQHALKASGGDENPTTSTSASTDAPSTTSSQPSTSPSTSSAPSDWVSLALEVDNGGANATNAQHQLELEAAKHGIDVTSEDYPSWLSIAQAFPSPETASSSEEESIPTKGDVYQFAFRAGIPESPCRVTKSLKGKQTVDLIRLSDDKDFSDIPWDKLGKQVS